MVSGHRSHPPAFFICFFLAFLCPKVSADFIGLDRNGDLLCDSPSDMGVATGVAGVRDTFDLFMDASVGIFSWGCTFCVNDSNSIIIDTFLYNAPQNWTQIDLHSVTVPLELRAFFPRAKCLIAQAVDFDLTNPIQLPARLGSFAYEIAEATCVGFVIDGSLSGYFSTGLQSVVFDNPADVCSQQPCGLSLTVNGVSPECPVPPGHVGETYPGEVVFTAAGGSPPYTWSQTGMPTGLDIDPPTGEVVGTPTTMGDFSFVATVTDSLGDQASRACSLVIVEDVMVDPDNPACPLPHGMRTEPYSESVQFKALGGAPPYIWSSVGLPTGMAIISNTGFVVGIPANTGKYVFTVTVADSELKQFASTDSRTCSMRVFRELKVGTLQPECPIPPATPGEPYPAGTTFQASGGLPPYGWTASGLPTGIFISPSGEISGQTNETGPFLFTVTVTDSLGQSDNRECSIDAGFPVLIDTLDPICPLPFVLRGAPIPAAYSFHFFEGIPPIGWSASGLPPGVTIDPGSGQLVGSATSVENYPFTVSVTDKYVTSSRDCALRVVDPLQIDESVPACPLPTSDPNEPYPAGSVFSANGGLNPYIWSQAGLPGGMLIDSLSGEIGGTPLEAGTFLFEVSAVDQLGLTDTVSCEVTIGPSFLGFDRNGDMLCDPSVDLGTILAPIGSVDTLDLFIDGFASTTSWACTFCLLDSNSVLLDTFIYNTPPAWTDIPLQSAAVPAELQSQYPLMNCFIVQSTDFSFTEPVAIPSTLGSLIYEVASEPCVGFLLHGPGSGYLSTELEPVIFTDPHSTCGTYSDCAVTVAIDEQDPVCPLPQAKRNQPYVAPGPFIAAEGFPPFTWSQVGLPSGLDIDPQTGLVSGTSSAGRGTYPFTVTMQDEFDRVATRECRVRLCAGALCTFFPMQVEIGGITLVEQEAGVRVNWTVVDVSQFLRVHLIGGPAPSGDYEVLATEDVSLLSGGAGFVYFDSIAPLDREYYLQGDLITGGVETYGPVLRVSATGLPGSEVPAPGKLTIRSEPNPFNPTTTLSFALSGAGHVRLDIYDARGSHVKRLVDESLLSGAHQIVWGGKRSGGSAAPSGIYFARLRVGDKRVVTKLVLIR